MCCRASRIRPIASALVRDLKGLWLTPDAALADAPPLDILHVPGGFGQDARSSVPRWSSRALTPGSRVSPLFGVAATRSVAVMNSALTVIDPAAPRCRNPIAIGANPNELRCGCGTDHTYWKRSGIGSMFVALGKTGRGYRDASHPRHGGRNNGEKRIGHRPSPQVNAVFCSNRSLATCGSGSGFAGCHQSSSHCLRNVSLITHKSQTISDMIRGPP